MGAGRAGGSAGGQGANGAARATSAPVRAGVPSQDSKPAPTPTGSTLRAREVKAGAVRTYLRPRDPAVATLPPAGLPLRVPQAKPAARRGACAASITFPGPRGEGRSSLHQRLAVNRGRDLRLRKVSVSSITFKKAFPLVLGREGLPECTAPRPAELQCILEVVVFFHLPAGSGLLTKWERLGSDVFLNEGAGPRARQESTE